MKERKREGVGEGSTPSNFFANLALHAAHPVFSPLTA